MPAAVDELLLTHGLRRTQAARQVLTFLLAHSQISYTHAQLQTAQTALRALGYKGLSMDVAVRGVCADCATAGDPR